MPSPPQPPAARMVCESCGPIGEDGKHKRFCEHSVTAMIKRLFCAVIGHKWRVRQGHMAGDITAPADCARCGEHFSGIVWERCTPRMPTVRNPAPSVKVEHYAPIPETQEGERMKAANITASELIDLMVRQRPTVYWEIGRDALPHVRQLADDTGRYLMEPGRIVGDVTLLGYSIQVVPGDEVRLITLVSVGQPQERKQSHITP